MNFSLSEKLEAYVKQQVEQGHFNNASEVVRDALRLHEVHQMKLAELRREIQLGLDDIEAGRVSDETPMEVLQRVRKEQQG